MAKWSPIWNDTHLPRRARSRKLQDLRDANGDTIRLKPAPGWRPPTHFATKLLESATKELKRAQRKQAREFASRAERRRVDYNRKRHHIQEDDQ